MAKASEYNPVATALLEPFDESEINTREGSGGQSFSFVPPEHYRRRLLKVFTEGFEFGLHTVNIGKTGISAVAYFKGTDSATGVVYIIGTPNGGGIPVFEPYKVGAQFLWNNETRKKDIPNPKAGQILDPEHTYSALASAGVKAVSREMGLGLHLYDKAPRTVENSRRTSSSNSGAAAGKSNGASTGTPDIGDWDGSKRVGIGKYKNDDTTWAEVDDGYLTYVTSGDKPNQNALKEIARRQREAGAEGAAQAQKSMNARAAEADDEDDEIPF